MPARILTVGEASLAEPARCLREGGLVAFPTETVYGLGADALSASAVERIYRAKGRPVSNPLIVHLPDASWIDRVVSEVTPLAKELIEDHWPGPLTLVLDAAPSVPRLTTGGLSTVAVRVPDHAVARELIAAAGTPVAAPSANRSGRPSPTTAQHVLDDLGDAIDWVVDGGPCKVGIESTVVDARGAVPVVLRDGGLSREALGAMGEQIASARSPGTRHPHYRPRCAVLIAAPGEGVAVANASGPGLVGLVAPDTAGLTRDVVVVASPQTAQEMGRVLYSALRDADDRGITCLVVEGVAPVGPGRAVMDRLRRASGER